MTVTHSLPEATTTVDDAPAIAHPRTIRSFVRRAGRVTTAQARAIAALGNTFVIPYQTNTLDTQAIFGRTAPLILEIGFGMGEATAHIAALQPEYNFLGCEVHSPGVGALLKRIGEQQLDNIRICAHDAVEVLHHMLAENSLHGVHIFFPRPLAQNPPPQAPPDSTPIGAIARQPPGIWRIHSLRYRLAALCRTDSGSAQRPSCAAQHQPLYTWLCR